jgi:6-phosphogluconate dehydrogenase (decarboxylating)
MEVELIGLGKMATRLRQGGHTVVGFDFGAFAREDNNFSDRKLAIMRNAFGGHAVKKS